MLRRPLFLWFASAVLALLTAFFVDCTLHLADEPSPDKTPTLVYRGAKIHTASGPPIESGVLVVRGGKVVAVGPEGEVNIPRGASVRDVTGKVIIPGLVDTHSHIGLFGRGLGGGSDGNEMTGPVQPGVRAVDGINPNDPGIRMALAGGVTTANIMPGSGNAIGGQTLYVKLRGAVIEAMRVLADRVLGGIKFANGENVMKSYGNKGQAPMTRMKVAALQREALLKARDYQRRWEDHRAAVKASKKSTPPERDLALEPLVEVLQRKRTVHFHCHRADDIMTAVRLSQEFGFELVLQHCTEGYRVAEELGKLGLWVSLTLIDSPGGKPEVLGLLEENAAILEKAGVKVAINTDDMVTESRFFLRTGAIAVRGGMSEEAALRALTLHGAQMLHLDHRCGSLEKGKDADFVVLSGAPFSVYTQVLETHIEGVKVFDRSQHEDWTYATGGFILLQRDRLPKRAALVQPLAPVRAPALPKGAKKLQGTAERYVILAGRIHTVSEGTITDGVIVVEKGKIAQLGPRKKVQFDPQLPVLTAAVVTPGLIDAHSSVGMAGITNIKQADQDHDEHSDPNQADLRTLDSFNPDEPLLKFVREQGVTVVHAVPGRSNFIAGQTGVFRTHGRTAEQMALKSPFALQVNLGEVPKGSYPTKVGTRMGVASFLRTAFTSAQNHARKKSDDKQPPVNLKLEALAPAVSGKLPVVFSAHRADDINTALRLSDEFRLQPLLCLATEGYLLRDQLAARKVPVIVHPTMQRPSGGEVANSHLSNAAVLADAGIPIAICTGFEGYVPRTRVLRYEAAMAMCNGLGYERALEAITLAPAKLLGISEQHGSITTGKVADIVLYDGDPFEHVTHVTHTIMAGRVIHDRAEYLQVPFARRALPLFTSGDLGCCLGQW